MKTMTVGELTKRLAQYDPATPVLLDSTECYFALTPSDVYSRRVVPHGISLFLPLGECTEGDPEDEALKAQAFDAVILGDAG